MPTSRSKTFTSTNQELHSSSFITSFFNQGGNLCICPIFGECGKYEQHLFETLVASDSHPRVRDLLIIFGLHCENMEWKDRMGMFGRKFRNIYQESGRDYRWWRYIPSLSFILSNWGPCIRRSVTELYQISEQWKSRIKLIGFLIFSYVSAMLTLFVVEFGGELFQWCCSNLFLCVVSHLFFSVSADHSHSTSPIAIMGSFPIAVLCLCQGCSTFYGSLWTGCSVYIIREIPRTTSCPICEDI